MQEELDKATLRDFPIDLKSIRVVGAGAAERQVINDLEHLDRMLKR